MRLVKTILSLIVLVFPFLIFAKTYYVANSGSNENPGTIESPFKTISYGVDHMSGGDTLYVRGGTYNEQVTIYGVSGTADNQTVISGYQDELPIIDGTGVSIGAGSALIMNYAEYSRITGFEIRNVNLNEEGAGGSAIYMLGNHQLTSNCIMHDLWSKAIMVQADSCIVENCTSYNTSLMNEDLVEQDGEIWSNGMEIRGRPSDTICGSVIRNCIVYNSCGEGVSLVFTDRCIIEDCIIYDIYSTKVYVRNSQNALIQRNMVYQTRPMRESNSTGIGLWNEGSYEFTNKNNTIINNIVYGAARNLYCGIPNSDSTLIANNTFVNGTYKWNVHLSPGSSATGRFINNLVIQEDTLECIFVNDPADLTISNNLYNKTYHTNARGDNDIIGDCIIAKTGIISAGELPGSYFKLLKTSEAIDRGINIGVRTDFEGSIRDDYPDIGAYEFESQSEMNNISPFVEINFPSEGARFEAPATITILVEAYDDDSITKVEFFNGAFKIGESYCIPWIFTWSNVPVGDYNLKAVTINSLGAKTTSVTVKVQVYNNIPPIVEVTTPSNGTDFKAPAIITISANAVDPDGSISKVEFYNGLTKLYEETANPWSYTWYNVPAGQYTIKTIAIDNMGASTTSVIYVSVSPDFKLYPNPNDGNFIISLNRSEFLINEIINVFVASEEGRVIYQGNMKQHEIIKQFSLPNLESGIYIVKLCVNEFNLAKRFFKLE